MLVSLLETLRPARTRGGFPCMAGELPGIGHALSLHIDAVDTLRRAHAALGPLFWVRLGSNNWFLFCTGPGALDLLKDPRVATAGSRDTLRYLLGDSLLNLDGPRHRRVRSTMNAPFSPRGLAESQTGRCILQVVRDRAQRWTTQAEVHAHDEMKEMALDVVLRISGVGEHDLPTWRTKYSQVLLGLLPIQWDFPLSPRRRALQATAWLNSAIAQMIATARASSQGEGLLHALAHARNESGQPLSSEELIDNVRLLFLAGHETTATTTAWAVLQLSQQPALWDRLLLEANEAPAIPTTLAEAKAFPLCEAIFRESVRMYGPAWFIERRTTEPIEHAGKPIPAHTAIAVAPSLWGRDAAQFADPDRFHPDRWLHRPALTPIELSQFGGGAHFCLGYHLAWLESVAFLVALARQVTNTPGCGPPQLRGVDRLYPRYFPMPHPPTNARLTFRR